MSVVKRDYQYAAFVAAAAVAGLALAAYGWLWRKAMWVH